MRVRCASTAPGQLLLTQLGSGYDADRVYDLEIGREYVVVGLTFPSISAHMGVGVWVQYSPDRKMIHHAPICLFEIVDGTPSSQWKVRMEQDGSVFVCPPNFYRPFYHSDLADGVQEIVHDFSQVICSIENEDKLGLDDRSTHAH